MTALRSLAVACVVLGCTPAVAQPPRTIEEKRHRVNAEELVAEDVNSMNWICKTAIPEIEVIDWTTWKQPIDGKGNHVANQCRHVAAGAERLCRSGAIAQQALAKNVRRIVCRGDAQGDIKFELKGNTLVVRTFLGVTETDRKTQQWLYANLNP